MASIELGQELHPLNEALDILNLSDNVLAQDSCELQSIESRVLIDVVHFLKDITLFLALKLDLSLQSLVIEDYFPSLAAICQITEAPDEGTLRLIITKESSCLLFKVIDAHILPNKLEVFLIEEYLQFKESSILLPNTLIYLWFHAVNKLLVILSIIV